MPKPYLTNKVELFSERLKLAIGKSSVRGFALQCGDISPAVNPHLIF